MQTRAPDNDRKDAYLDWGLATGFRYFFKEQRQSPDGGSIGLLIEWNSVEDAARGAKVVAQAKLSMPRIYAGGDGAKPQRVWSLSVPVSAVERIVEAIAPLARRVELAAPVTPGGDLLHGARGKQSDTTVLAGVLDDGCVFANARFMQSNQTRVLWLWNQDMGAVGLPLDALSGPSANCNFGYGGQWSQQSLDDLINTLQGRQDLIYARADLPTLRRAAAHGPHVTDLLCGAEQWQIAFVQFPQAGIDDPSGRWLARYALDGLHYLLECAGPKTYTIVVNLSWGPQTGPHNGHSALELAIDDVIDQQAKLGRKLIVALPAGNSFSAQAHARIDCARGGKLHWIVPPDGYTPAFLEVWWPTGVQPSDAQLRVTTPSGSVANIGVGAPVLAPNWFAALKTLGGSTMALVVNHPTEERTAHRRGEHGKWTLEVAPCHSASSGKVHVYVARADHNMGARRRAKSSFLTDPALEAARFVAPANRFDEAPGSAIRRHGTLNGLATGAKSHVASGYRFSDFKCVPYSSAGRARAIRVGPDFACVTDISAAVSGIRAAGVRSGTTIRLVGTSTAAPQLGRQLANNSLIEFEPVPLPADAAERIGVACLWPDDGVVHKE